MKTIKNNMHELKILGVLFFLILSNAIACDSVHPHHPQQDMRSIAGNPMLQQELEIEKPREAEEWEIFTKNFHDAAYDGNLDIVVQELWRKGGSSINLNGISDGTTNLHKAVDNGHFEIVQCLLNDPRVDLHVLTYPVFQGILEVMYRKKKRTCCVM